MFFGIYFCFLNVFKTCIKNVNVFFCLFLWMLSLDVFVGRCWMFFFFFWGGGG